MQKRQIIQICYQIIADMFDLIAAQENILQARSEREKIAFEACEVVGWYP